MQGTQATSVLEQGSIGLASIAVLSLAYLLVLFCVGRLGQRLSAKHPLAPWIFSFALAVYCTSWAFYGVTAQAAINGWWIPPTYIGSILLYWFGFRLVSRIAITARRFRITSVADFIATRFGHSRQIALVCTLILLMAVIPYIALQLQAITTSIDALLQHSNSTLSERWYQDTGLYVTFALAVFSLLFAGKSAQAHQPNPGLMTAIAFESLVKLIALLAVGGFVCFGLFDGFTDLFAKASLSQPVQQLQQQAAPTSVYWIHVLLGFLATLCLPRQFHISFVEIQQLSHLRYARWIFPSYLLLMSLFTLPLALAGSMLLPQLPSVDLVVLQLPLIANRTDIALLAYLGGFSAATSMVIVATVVLGIIISNDLLTPLLHRQPQPHASKLSVVVLRRGAMLFVLALGYLYYRGIGSGSALSQLGLMAFLLIAQLAPALLFGLTQRQLNRQGALAGLCGGAFVWAYLLLLPELHRAGLISWAWLHQGPFGFSALSVTAMQQWTVDPIALGTILSLAINTGLLFAVSHFSRTRMAEWIESAAFVRTHPATSAPTPLSLHDCYSLVRRFDGEQAAHDLFRRFGLEHSWQSLTVAPSALQQGVERRLAAIVGGASMRLLLNSAAAHQPLPLESVARFVDEASQVYQFNQALLSSTLEHINLGVSVVDRDLRLIAWNQQYVDMFHYPPDLIEVGTPVEDLIRYNARRGFLSLTTEDDAAIEQEIDKRLTYLRQGSRYKFQRRQQDGRVFEMQGNPLPGGGFVTTYTDVSSFITVQQQLEAANDTLEQRVQQRTAQLQQLNAELAAATLKLNEQSASKHRFFAATGHDLMQPLNAASLFAGLIREKTSDETIRQLAQHLSASLATADELLAGILELTKLESGAIRPQRQGWPLTQLLDQSIRDAGLLASQKQLKLRVRLTNATVFTDGRLLKRVVQNLLSNAIRYTKTGRILVGCRRVRLANDKLALRLEVWDTGVGISHADQQKIFQEFQQGHAGDQQGLGIGLAISQRICLLLDHSLTVRSVVGKGSCFAVTLPLGEATAPAQPSLEPSRPAQFSARTILLLDNDPQLREAVASLLRSWECVVFEAATPGEALLHWQQQPQIDLLMFDYHLDQGATGVSVAQQLLQHFRQPVPVIIHSADQTQTTRDEALNAGFHFMLKPLKPAPLKRLLQRFFR